VSLGDKKDIWPVKVPHRLTPDVLLWTAWNKKTEGESADWGSNGKQAVVKMETGIVDVGELPLVARDLERKAEF